MKTIKFYTLGCKVNQYETQAIREQFLRGGFAEIDHGKIADIYLINTCTVTHRADRDSLRFIYRAKRENPQAKIVVTGCLTELDNEKISRIDNTAIIIKNKDKDRIIRFLNERNEPNKLNKPNKFNDNKLGINYFKDHTRAFLKIQDGCNNSCSYCKVPLVRGISRSRHLEAILKEAERLVGNGYKEIVLSGICLGAYGQDLSPKISILEVIEGLEKIEGFLRIRLSSIEAADVSDRLIEKMAQLKKLCRHLHIPAQSGDDEILKKMNRKYCRDDYLALIKRIKSLIPEIAITTDVLVGFPGESEVNFQNTVDLIKKITPLKVHIFPYSRREGTPAASFNPELSPKIIKERITRLKNVAESCALKYKKQFLNKDMEVLIEAQVKDKPDFWEGHTDNYVKVLVKSNFNLKNQVISVRLKELFDGSYGTL